MTADAAVAAVFHPVKTPTTFEETVDRLGTAIRLGILAPGSRLPSERELADQLAISRSTLRQAITALVESGHLTSLRGRSGGTFVVPEPPLAEGSAGPPPRRLRPGLRPPLPVQTRRVRPAPPSEIEPGVVVPAPGRAAGEPIAILRDAVARMEAATEFDEYRRADVRFHIALAQATGVPRLVALMTEVQSEVSELIAHIAHPPQVLRHSNADHVRLIDALEAHDAARAMRELRLHLDGTEHILSGLMPAGA